MSARPGSRWTRELARELRVGYRLAPTGRSKFFVVDSRGRKLRMANGQPVVLPNSPSNYRSIVGARRMLRSLGALR